MRLSSLALLFVTGCGLLGPTEPPVEPPKPLVVTTAVAELRDMPRFLRVTGTLVAVDDADIAAQAAGNVERILADRGDVVAKNAALITLDTSTAALQAKEAAASVAGAATQVQQAQADCARASSLAEAGGLAAAERDRLLSQCEQGSRQLEAARARQQLADLNLSRATVRAPFAGLVAERLVSPGEYVTPGRAVLKLVALDPLRLELSVPERAASSVSIGAYVTFVVADPPDTTVTVPVARISPALRERTRDLVVEAQVPNAEGKLRPNSFAVARLALPLAAALTIPEAAILKSGETARVFVARDGIAEENVVETGEALDGFIEIRSGLVAGDRVITPLPAGITDGAKLVTP